MRKIFEWLLDQRPRAFVRRNLGTFRKQRQTRFVGSGTPGANFIALWASGTISNVAATNNVPGYTASIVDDPTAGHDYQLKSS